MEFISSHINHFPRKDMHPTPHVNRVPRIVMVLT